MANNPKTILADEPTDNLHDENAENVIEAFELVRRDFGATIVLTTHDRELSRHATMSLRLSEDKAARENS